MKVLPSLFTKTEFSPDEQLSAVTFTSLQLAHLRNEQAIAAEKFVLVKHNLENLVEGVINQSYIQGQIDIITLLIAMSEDAQDMVDEVIKRMAQTQEEN